MRDLDFNGDGDSDQEVSEKHPELLDAVRQLDKGQRIKKLEQYEPSLEISEFSTLKSATETLDQDALGINGGKIKAKLVSAPLERPAAERIKRTVGFENTKKELAKWTGIVARNRTAACISFPLSQTSMKLQGTDEYVKRFRLRSELEKKLAEVDKQEEEVADDKDEFPLTLQEILEQRHEAAKFRAQQSYKAAKATRQKKIKSKKYHRIQRKEKIKKALKEFEELQKTDPQAALEKLEQLDKARAEERMTLRHKSTGQWAKSKQVRAKYDKESRQVLAEQLSISKELTQKVRKDEDSEDDDDDENDAKIQLPKGDEENPWINPVKSQSEVDDFISGYRKYWDAKNKSQNEASTSSGESGKNDASKIRKTFKVPEIQDVPRCLNPVEKVVEEYSPGHAGHHTGDGKKRKILQRSSKDKLGLKSTVNKINKSKKPVKAGTSSWSVSPVESLPTVDCRQSPEKHGSQDIDVDQVFDSLDEKLREKIAKKLDKVKRELERQTKRERNKKGKEDRTNWEMNDIEKLGLKGQRMTKPVIDKPIEETTRSKPTAESAGTEKITDISEFNKRATHQSSKTEIDPSKFMNMKPKHIKTSLPDELGQEEALDDAEAEDQYQIISEAFADDDVVDEFRKEKEQEIKDSQPEDIDLRLPGWGSWGGKDIKQPLRKKRRFIITVPKEAPRRDENKGDVVIIEEKSAKIKQHLVNELPFPFSSVQDFEASIRAPLGREFVPEKTFGKLITPHVKTKSGKIIEPMSEDVLVKTDHLKKRRKRPSSANDKRGGGGGAGDDDDKKKKKKKKEKETRPRGGGAKRAGSNVKKQGQGGAAKSEAAW